MGANRSSGGDRLLDDVADTLRRVREVDPHCDEASVRRYVLEIAEADGVLKRLELDDALPVAPFSPDWNPETRR